MLISAIFIVTFIRSINRWPLYLGARTSCGGPIHAPVPGSETPQETPGIAEESLLAEVPLARLPVLIELEKVPVACLS